MRTSTRRSFFLQSAAAAGVFASGASGTFGQNASSKITVGLIGCGGRGTHDGGLFQSMPNVELAYVCDVDESRRGATAAKLGVNGARVVGDLRRILDDKSVD